MPNVAAETRRQKEKWPQSFCQHPKCLWRVVKANGIVPCPRHANAQRSEADEDS